MRIVQFKKDESGNIVQQACRVYFPRSEFHCRFPSYFQMNDPVRWSTYHRSDFKVLEGVKKYQFKFMGNQTTSLPGMYAKTGNYFNPFHFKKYQSALKTTRKIMPPSAASEWYDRLLNRQKKMAAYVVEQVHTKDKEFTINADNNYTCVLFQLPKPAAEKNPKIWSQILAAYLIALTNKLAYDRGINIELIERSSFGCLRPAVAECGDSVRINLGLCPTVYADCVVDALIYLKKLFGNADFFKLPMQTLALTKVLKKYNTINSSENKTVNVHLKSNLWDTLWAPGDSSNKSFASQIFRKSSVVEYLIDLIVEATLQKNLADVFNNKTTLMNTFAHPLKKILLAIKLNEKALSIDIDSSDLKTFSWQTAQPIEDEEFWGLIKDFAERIDAPKPEVASLLTEKKLEDLHSRFEAWLANFTFMPKFNKDVEDGGGSDSEEEQDVDIEGTTQKIHAKKIITATGMRAIQLIYAVAQQYLHDEYQIDPLQLRFSAEQMYYETHEGLSRFSIPLEFEQVKQKKKTQQNISFFDVNHCNTSHQDMGDPIELIGKTDKVCAIDITSATTNEVHHILTQLLKERPQLEVVLMVSSGLKNEQAMADYNPYGTVRIFAKTHQSLDKIYSDLVALEEVADYKHPKQSHLIRKTAKECGMTLTNKSILNP